MIIPSEISIILNTLINKGYKAYIVGGAVRDFLIGNNSYDIDITTNASSSTIRELFSDYSLFEIGKELGTITIVLDKYKVDITPFRKEGEYTKHRRPSNVTFSNNINDDLSRRDFTINAICINDNELIDLYNGQEDINNKIIRAIGNPNHRFEEDALRILRAIRFKAKLDFVIEEYTNSALFKEKELLRHISNERKKDELLKILSCHNSFNILKEYKTIFNIFISIDKIDDRIDHFNNPYFKLALLLNEDIMKELKPLTFSKHEISLLKALYKVDEINIEDDYCFITLLSSKAYQKEILLFINELYVKSFKEKLLDLKEYIVNDDNIDISSNELIFMGYVGKEIKEIKDILVENIHKKNFKNHNQDIKEYLKCR